MERLWGPDVDAWMGISSRTHLGQCGPDPGLACCANERAILKLDEGTTGRRRMCSSRLQTNASTLERRSGSATLIRTREAKQPPSPSSICAPRRWARIRIASRVRGVLVVVPSPTRYPPAGDDHSVVPRVLHSHGGILRVIAACLSPGRPRGHAGTDRRSPWAQAVGAADQSVPDLAAELPTDPKCLRVP